MSAREKNYRYASALLAVLFLLLGGLSAAHAATFVVTTTSDGVTDGVCDAQGTGDGCTLREAINAANAAPGDDVISFDPDVTGTINLTGALPDLATNIALQGPGARNLTVRCDTGGDYNVFRALGNITVSISGLTITNGAAPDDSPGGGVRTGARVTLADCTISGNTARGDGGGIGNTAFLTVLRCTVSGNTAAGDGGGIWNLGSQISLSNSTVSGNSAGNRGGGLYNNFVNNPNPSVTLDSCTFSGNVNSAGAAIYSGGGTVTISNTIFHRTNSDPNVVVQNTTFNSSGYNISNDGTGPSSQTDRRNTDPRLGPLQDNGGPTDTHALGSGSPAIDTGSTTLANDQRGRGRPFDGDGAGGAQDDVGAVEQGSLGTPQIGPDYLVNSTLDTNDGSCSFINCTLREAINAANSRAGANNITFDPMVFAAPRQTIVLDGTRLPTISGDLMITAPAAGVVSAAITPVPSLRSTPTSPSPWPG